MDPVTHAASGAIALLCLRRRPETRWALPFAALAAAIPDIDIVFAATPLAFLQLHRGITHSLAALPLLALLLTFMGRPLWNRRNAQWSWVQVFALACACLGLHIWLDAVTTYGTMAFLPFSTSRIRLNGVYIIDPLLTLPLLWACLRCRRRPAGARLAMLWIFLYPALCVALGSWHGHQTAQRLNATNGRAAQVTVLPDALGPFFWRAIYTGVNAGKPVVCSQGLNAMGSPRTAPESVPALPVPLAGELRKSSARCGIFLDFALLPVVRPLPEHFQPADAGNDAGLRYLLVHDLRFGSSLNIVNRLMSLRASGDPPFLLMLELGADGTLRRERLRFADSRLDSGWQPPLAPAAPDVWHWLIGLRQSDVAASASLR